MSSKITPEIEQFIIDNHKGISTRRMACMVNEAFGIEISRTPVMRIYRNNGLSSGIDARFKPGCVSWNKGKKWSDFMSAEAQESSSRTCFKPGHIPHNGGSPVGEIRLRQATRNKPGSKPYYWQKTAQPNVWRLKHQLEWEEHNGPVPEGYMVTFADGDTLNWHIDNLVLETRAQHLFKNRFKLHGYDRESEETCNLLADLASASYQRSQKNKD